MQWPWRKANNDLDREVQYHLETLADGYERQGMTRQEAMRRARIDFGGVDQVKEECREESRWYWATQLFQDVRFGWRMMRKTPSISVAAVVSLALGIGATTAILALADTILWRALPLPAPERLSEVYWVSKARVEMMKGSSGSMYPENGMRVADFFSKDAFDNMRARAAGKAEVAAHIHGGKVSASFRGEVTVTYLRGVSGNFFSMLAVQPFAGRLLSNSDDTPGSAPAVVVTYAFFRRHLGADPNVMGETLRINNIAYVIAGVLPEGFRGISPADNTSIYTSIHQAPQVLNPGNFYGRALHDPLSWWIQLMVRRAPETNVEELQSQLNAAFAATWPRAPKTPESTPRIRLSDASRGLGGARRQLGNPVAILLVLVAMVLVVACANIANLLLARAVQREKEVALRVSLGCGQARLMRQFFTESLLLAAIGGLFSLGVAQIFVLLLANLTPGADGNSLPVEFNGRAAVGTGAITMLTAILFGLYPAWRATRVHAAPALKEGSGSGGTVSRGRWLPAKTLVLVQVSFGVLLLTSAILYISHLNEVVNRDTGFERNHIVMLDVRPGELGYRKDRLKNFYLRIEEQLAQLEGVESVGLAVTRPMLGGGYWNEFHRPGSNRQVSSAVHHCSPSFLSTLGIRIVEGRMLTLDEVRAGAKVAVVSETFARQLGDQALGSRMAAGKEEYLVVGIARNARYSGMTESPPVAYIPFQFENDSATVVVRTRMSPAAVLPAVERVVREMDRNLPLLDVYTMEQQISRVLQRERMFAWLCGSFGVLALVLCIVGLYGLMSHTTARRTPEIGIRIALGASRRLVMTQVLGEGMRLAGTGLVLGLPLAYSAARLAQSRNLLPENEMPYGTLVAAIAVLAVSALAAVAGPAVRASAVDPMEALRRN